MKKIFLLCLTTIMLFALSNITNARHRYNPFEDMFKHQARMEHRVNIVKNVFVLFDEQEQQIKAPFSIVYVDKSENLKTVQAETTNYFAYINFDSGNYFNVLKVQYNGKEYEILGDAYEDFDYKDVYQGEVEYYALKLNNNTLKARIYDAD